MEEILRCAKKEKNNNYKTYEKYKKIILDKSTSYKEYEESIVILAKILRI